MRTTTETVAVPSQALLRLIDAARLGSIDHGNDIRAALVELRSAVHADISSELSELYGPLGPLERLLDERDSAEPGQLDPAWSQRWLAVLEGASAFLHRATR